MRLQGRLCVDAPISILVFPELFNSYARAARYGRFFLLRSSKKISSLALVLLVACEPVAMQKQESSARQSTERTSSQGNQGNSDLAVAITIPNTWTNARKIPVSWAPVDKASEYQLDIAGAANCQDVKQSLRTKNTSTELFDLAEGTWYLCLKWKIEAKIKGANDHAINLVVDRRPPEIIGEAIQTLALNESPKVTVTDQGDVSCLWSSSEEKLDIIKPETLNPKFSGLTAGTYIAQLSCTDAASNISEQSFSLALQAEPAASMPQAPENPVETPAPPAAPVPAPTVNAGQDLLRNQTTALMGTAANAQSYLWSKVSGPGTLDFSAATSLQTNVNASLDGTYVIRLTVTGSTGLTAQDEMTLTWDTTAPTVNAGQDIIIGAATNLQGTAGIDAVSLSWRKVSGAGAITFSSTSILAPMVSASVDDIYVLELKATDAAGNFRTDQMNFQWTTTVPTVNVGPDLAAKASVSLSPTTSNATTYAWSKVSGPGTITFSAPSAKNTNVTASTDGSYVIRLTITSSTGQTANDSLTLTWDTVAPTVNAGLDRSANLLFTQTGTSTGGSTYAWTKVSGPGTPTFGSANALTTTITASVDGSYTLRLTALDAAGNSGSDDMILVWDVTAPNQVSGLSATPGVKSMTLAWTDGGGGTQAYLVLRSTAAITDSPVRGTLYTSGSTLGASTVVSVSAGTGFTDSNLTGNVNYFYKVFAHDSLGNYSSGVEVSAVAEPLKTLKATLTRTGFYTSTKIMGIFNAGSLTAVCREESGVGLLNVSNPAAPAISGTNSLGNNVTAGWCSDVKIQGAMAYIADWDKGLITVDISNPAAPVVRGSLVLTNASVLLASGNYVYVAVEDDTTGGGLAIVNVSNPAAPTLTSYTETDGNAAGVAKIGNYVYLSHRDTGNFVGMKVFNVSNPASPTIVQSIVRSNMEEVTVEGHHVYVAEGFDGFEIFDASNPASLVSRSVQILPDTPDSGYAMSVGVGGNYAFVPSYDTNKMYVVDISSKTSPSVVRTYATFQTQPPLYIHVSGAHAYLSIEGKGMEIIEVFTLQ